MLGGTWMKFMKAIRLSVPRSPQPLVLSPPSSHSGSVASGGEGSIVVRLAHLVRNVLGVGDAALAINDEDGAREEPPLLDEHPVVAAELLVPVAGEGLVRDVLR